MVFIGSHKREALALLFVVSALAAAVIWVRIATVKDTYYFVAQERQWQKLQEDAQEARVRWLKLTAPRRLESMAQSLGLEAPQIDQVLKYPLDKGQPHRANN